ncbi:hypothetical protein GCM10023116_33240 [Kistimonas scapharcae]|uniref:DUF3324 domain-containing protein n=1 Tax=Kistimonas scapharcae TaxID=1036133 RepID=A0ABP8V568_9GAMM
MIKLYTLLITLLFSLSVMASGIAVSPLIIELKSESSDTVPFEFTISGKEKAKKVRLSVYDMKQQNTGHMGFIETLNDNNQSKAAWVRLEKDEYTIKKDASIQVPGKIKIPPRSPGNHLVAVMVEELKENASQQGISINVRYAVILNITVEDNKRRPRVKTDFQQLELVKLNDRLMLMGDFANLSQHEGFLQSEVQIRDQDRKLVERVRLMTESAWQRQDPASRVFPGSNVKVFGFISRELDEGDYEFKVRNRFSDKTQPTYKVRLKYDDSIRQIIRKKAANPEAEQE